MTAPEVLYALFALTLAYVAHKGLSTLPLDEMRPLGGGVILGGAIALFIVSVLGLAFVLRWLGVDVGTAASVARYVPMPAAVALFAVHDRRRRPRNGLAVALEATTYVGVVVVLLVAGSRA